MIPLIIGVLLFVLLILLGGGLGRRILLLLHIGGASPLERGVLALGLGLGFLQFLPFALFTVGLGTPAGMRLGALVLGAILVPDMLGFLLGAGRFLRGLPRLPFWQKLFAMILCALLATVFLRSVCPPTDGDALSYHLTSGIRYLEAGRFVFLPTIVHAHWPLGVEMLYALLLGLTHSATPAVAQFALGLTAVSGAYLIGKRLGGPEAGAAAAALLLLHKGFWDEFALAYVDLGTAAFATLAVLALITARSRRTDSGRWRAAAALFAGLAACSKLNGVWVIASLALILTLPETDDPVPLAARLRKAGRFVALAGAIVLPWFVRTWALTGNPLYPAFYGIFGGREWTAEGYSRLHEFYLRLNVPPGLPATPGVLWGSHAALAAAGISMAAVVILFTRRSRVAVPARFAALFTALVWTFSIFNLRFLMAAIPSLSAALTAGVSRFEKPTRLLVCSAAALLAVPLMRGVDPDLPIAARVAAGITPTQEYQRAGIMDWEIVRYANSRLPSGSVILTSALAHDTGLYRFQTLIADYWTQDSIHYETLARLESDLRRLRVTHLVIQTKYPEWCPRSAVCARREAIEQKALLNLARMRGDLLYTSREMSLFRLRR